MRHRDSSTEQIKFEHLNSRKISIVVFLNDASSEPNAETFCGGSLTFYGPDDVPRAEASGFDLKGETGLLVAFAADTLHEVQPVTHGERFTIISWFR